jgi:hypothetical protein
MSSVAREDFIMQLILFIHYEVFTGRIDFIKCVHIEFKINSNTLVIFECHS